MSRACCRPAHSRWQSRQVLRCAVTAFAWCAGLVHQPPAEGTAIFPRLIIPDPLCDILQNVLDHIIGLGVPQTRPQGQALDETSVEAVELIPTRVIAPVAETEEEARSG